MPLKEEIFNQLLDGKVHDNEIKADDIVSYKDKVGHIDLYIMSIAINPSFQIQHLGLRDLGFEKLFNSLTEKLIEHYRTTGIKVKRIAAVGWTEKGKRMCKLLGLEDTGKSEEKTNKPIYALELNDKTDRKNVHKSILKLLNLYNI
jgi:hypothetical protein